MTISRSWLAAVLVLAAVPPALAQTTPVPPPSPMPPKTEVVGEKPATFAEVMAAVDLCRRATHPKATFEYRLLRDEGYGIGSRKWDLQPGKERGELIWGFGKGNVAIFVRHGATTVNCKVIAPVSEVGTDEKVRAEILAKKWAKTFEEGAPADLKESLGKKYSSIDLSKILIGDQWMFGVAQGKNSYGREILTVRVDAFGAAR